MSLQKYQAGAHVPPISSEDHRKLSGLLLQSTCPVNAEFLPERESQGHNSRYPNQFIDRRPCRSVSLPSKLSCQHRLDYRLKITTTSDG